MERKGEDVADYDTALESLSVLDGQISGKVPSVDLFDIKSQISILKKDINKISLDMSLSMEDKLEFYFSLIDPITHLINKYQIRFSNQPDSFLYKHNYVELKILNHFLMWAIVSNSYNQHKFHFQITANLLSKVLETQSFEVSSDFTQVVDQASLDQFGQIFNFHQTSAGLYSSAIEYLQQIHIDNAKEWVEQAFYHYSEIDKLLRLLDLNQLYEIVQNDQNRNFYMLSSIFIFTALDFVKFIKSLFKIFGPQWHHKLDLDPNKYTRTGKEEFVTANYNLFKDMRTKILSIRMEHNEDYSNHNWTMFESSFTILKGNMTVIRHFNAYLRDEDQISVSDIEDQLKLVQNIADFQDFDNSDNSSLKYYFMDSLEKLVNLTFHSDLLADYKNSILEIIPSYLDKVTHVRNHEILLLYMTIKYQIFKESPELISLEDLMSYIDNFMENTTIETVDSIMIRVLNILICYEHELCSPENTTNKLSAILELHLDKLIGDDQKFRDYLEYLRSTIKNQNYEYSFPQIENNFWDWRTRIIPKFACDLQYIPLNANAFRIVYE